MYQPPHFREDDLAAQHALIRAHPLGLLITAGPGGLIANALPFHLVAERGAKGTLQVHMARANAQWREIGTGLPALVVFQGPGAYITPSWYETKRLTGKVAVVQVRGRARVIHHVDWLRRQIGALTGEHEAVRDQAWHVGDAPDAYISALIKGIVGVEIEILEIDGKWKVSQNRPAADVVRVAEALGDASEPHGNADMGNLVRQYGGRRGA